MIKALLKEPLLHFLLLGAVLYFFYTLTADNEISGNKITISDNKISQLKHSFEKTRQRKPNKQEHNALIDNFFKQQVAYQKGLEMGLHEGDAIIQKRIQQKLEFIIEDAVSTVEPTEEQLSEFLTEHSDDYRSPRLFSFMQLYFDPQRHQDVNANMQAANLQLTTSLKNETASDKLITLSDNIFLEFEYENLSYQQVARYFGSDFAKTLLTLPIQQWQQNIKSGYGVHIVKVKSKKGGDIQSIEQVRTQVKQAWLNQKRKETITVFYQNLFDEYQIGK